MTDKGVIRGYLVPHPPNLLEAEAKGEELASINALKAIGNEIRELEIDVIIVATTHWQPVGPFFIDASERHRHVTDYFGFSVEVDYQCAGDSLLAKNIMQSASSSGLLTDCVWGRGIDHGVTIPLHFLAPDGDIPVLPFSVSVRPMDECKRWGEVIAATCVAEGRRAAFIASSAISHRLPLISQPKAPSRYGRFEELMFDALCTASTKKLLDIDPALVEEAEPEGGLRDIMMLLGAMGEDSHGELMSYEPFFGLGFATFKLVNS